MVWASRHTPVIVFMFPPCLHWSADVLQCVCCDGRWADWRSRDAIKDDERLMQQGCLTPPRSITPSSIKPRH